MRALYVFKNINIMFNENLLKNQDPNDNPAAKAGQINQKFEIRNPNPIRWGYIYAT